MVTEEHSEPHEGQEEYQEDRVDDTAARVIQEKEVKAKAEHLEKEVEAKAEHLEKKVEATAEHLENKREATAEHLENKRMARADELERLVHEKEKEHRRIAWRQFASFLLIITISLIGWRQIEQEGDARCDSGEENRQALRNVVISIYGLGIAAVPPDTEMTPEVEAYLDRLETFKKEQLTLLDGSVCSGN